MQELSGLENAVHARLQSEISRLEALLAFGGVADDSIRRSITTFIDSARKQIQGIEIEQQKLEKEKREKEEQDIALSTAARLETALNAREQAEYDSFLKEDHFTKADFGKLEKFYTNTWDRLSENGKAEMSHRIWEGVRRKEYDFDDLPDIVKQKEAERLQGMLRDGAQTQRELQAIPIEDRQAFLNAWENNDRKTAYQILDRPSFVKNVAISPPPEIGESAVSASHAEAAQILKVETQKPEAPTAKATPQLMGTVDFKLDDIAQLDSASITPPLPEKAGAGRPKPDSVSMPQR